jgi:L-ascorbate metabolism protein UlaG (beta-lactamase superfamily)
MEITWNGLSSFEIKAARSSGDVRIVTDPYQNTTGLRFPRSLQAEMVLTSHDADDANNINAVAGEPYLIDMPGEYEVKDVFVFAIDAPLKREEKKKRVDNLIFRMEAEGMHVAHLGALDRALTDNELQQLNNIDILMIPVGGERVMTPKIAAEVISQVEPRIIIPMTHGLPSLKEKLGTVDVFCKEFGTCRREDLSKFKIKKKDLPDEDMLIVTLSK